MSAAPIDLQSMPGPQVILMNTGTGNRLPDLMQLAVITSAMRE